MTETEKVTLLREALEELIATSAHFVESRGTTQQKALHSDWHWAMTVLKRIREDQP